jgi:hypothetical protein
MKTRSQTLKSTEEFTPEFFDQASKAWNANKIRCANATYKYKPNAFAPEKNTIVETSLRRSSRLANKEEHH